jgi:hypothetical protein
MKTYEQYGFTDTDKENAKNSIVAIKNLSTSIKSTNEAAKSANGLISALKVLKQF